MLAMPLSLAASQFGSCLLRLYLRNPTTQFVLGLFVGTFIYCLTMALAIPDVFTTNPQWTTAVGLIQALITFGSLIVNAGYCLCGESTGGSGRTGHVCGNQ